MVAVNQDEKMRKPILTMIICAPLCVALAGCQSDSRLSQHIAKGCGLIESEAGCAARMAREEAADDAKCRGYGAQPGTDVYVQCRVGLDQIKATSEAAANAAAAADVASRRAKAAAEISNTPSTQAGVDRNGRGCLGQTAQTPYGPQFNCY